MVFWETEQVVWFLFNGSKTIWLETGDFAIFITIALRQRKHIPQYMLLRFFIEDWGIPVWNNMY